MTIKRSWHLKSSDGKFNHTSKYFKEVLLLFTNPYTFNWKIIVKQFELATVLKLFPFYYFVCKSLSNFYCCFLISFYNYFNYLCLFVSLYVYYRTHSWYSYCIYPWRQEHFFQRWQALHDKETYFFIWYRRKINIHGL